MWFHQARPAQYSMVNSGVLMLTEFSEEKLVAPSGIAVWRLEMALCTAELMEGCSWEMISWIRAA